jgi:hypothetical protein
MDSTLSLHRVCMSPWKPVGECKVLPGAEKEFIYSINSLSATICK